MVQSDDEDDKGPGYFEQLYDKIYEEYIENTKYADRIPRS